MLKYLLAFLPSFLHVAILRMQGFKIGKSVRIRFGTVLKSKNISIWSNTKIGPLVYIASDELTIGEHTVIKPLTLVSAKRIKLGSFVHIAPTAVCTGDKTPNSSLEIGDHSRIFPFSWLDTGEGIKIGSNVGVGGHSLIFTHSVWPDYLSGGPVTFGSVEIEDDVWLPWRVLIIPGVKIGKGSIVSANSMVNISLPPNSISAGNPVKIISREAIQPLSPAEKKERLMEILNSYLKYSNHINYKVDEDGIIFGGYQIKCKFTETATPNTKTLYFIFEADNDLCKKLKNEKASFILHDKKTYYTPRDVKAYNEFVLFLRRYGIRLYKVNY